MPNRAFACVFDAGYDSELNHAIARDDMGLRSIIPPLIGHPGRRRAVGAVACIGCCGRASRRRWQAETVNSMIKRNLGSALRGRTRASRRRDLWLKVLTHNVMMIRRQREGRDRAVVSWLKDHFAPLSGWNTIVEC